MKAYKFIIWIILLIIVYLFVFINESEKEGTKVPCYDRYKNEIEGLECDYKFNPTNMAMFIWIFGLGFLALELSEPWGSGGI